MKSGEIETLSDLSPSEIDSVSGGLITTIKPLEEGVYIDGVLVYMHAITLYGLLKSGAVDHVVTGGVP